MVPALICAEIVCSIYDYVLGSQSHFCQVSVDCWGEVQEQFRLLLIHILRGFLTNMACASVLTLASHFQNPNSPRGDVLYVSHDSAPRAVAVATSCYIRGKKKKKLVDDRMLTGLLSHRAGLLTMWEGVRTD